MVSASNLAAHAMQSVPCGTYAPGAKYVFDACSSTLLPEREDDHEPHA